MSHRLAVRPGRGGWLSFMRIARISALLAVALGGVSCGYHTAGKGSALPAAFRTIAIPAFDNQSQSYKVEQALTAAVVREFTTRTDFRIVPAVAPDADAILRGAVTNTQVSPLTYDSTTGRISSAMVIVFMRVSLTDSHGKILYQNPSFYFRDQYEVSREVSSFFQEESPALDRLSRDFARTLVSSILENY